MRKLHRVRGEEIEPQINNALKGQLSIPDSQVERKDKKLKKIEEHTDKLIEKSKQIASRSQARQEHIPSKSQADRKQNKRDPQKKVASLIEFHCLKGLPKIILKHIQKSIQYDDSLKIWMAVIDTQELHLITNKNPNHLSNALLRLEAQGWFEILRASNNGTRVLSIDPSLYSINH